MARVNPLGSVQFTVELSGAAVVFRNGGKATPRGENLRQLCQLFQENQLPVTWCLASHDDEALDFLQAESVCGDVALLVDTQLLPGTTNRQRFREIMHTALTRFQGRQLKISYIMGNMAALNLYPDVVRASGIRGVLGTATGGRVSRLDARPRLLRHGLTGIPCAASFPDRSGWWGRWDCAFRAKSVLVRARQQRTSEQIVIRELALSECGSGAWKSLQRLLRVTQRTMAHDRLRCETMTQVCDRLGTRRNTVAQRSILRAA